MKSSEEWIQRIEKDPKSSLWIKQGLRSALKRDPVEAQNDAQVLLFVLKLKWEECQKTGVLK